MMRRSRAKTYLKAIRHKAFRVECEAPTLPTLCCDQCGCYGWMAPPDWLTRLKNDSLSPADRIARALHPLALFHAQQPGRGVLCVSCAYSSHTPIRGIPSPSVTHPHDLRLDRVHHVAVFSFGEKIGADLFQNGKDGV